VLAQVACLVPQSVDPESTRPHTVPLIDLMQLPDYWYTPEVTLYRQSPTDQLANCHCELELQIPAIKEPDPTVTLEGRWFVDYDINNLGQSWVDNPKFVGAFNNVADVRGPVLYAFNADALKLDAGRHVVEFVIAEQDGWNTDTTVRPHHRSLNAGWDATALRLVVDVEPGSQVQQCDLGVGVLKPLTQRICPP
jgi:hypothetical protein